MSVLDRSELQASPLADLHTIADQLGIEGFRRMRKPELIDAILNHGPGEGGGEGGGEESGSAVPAPRPRRSPFRARRGRRARAAREEASEEEEAAAAEKTEKEEEATGGEGAGPREGASALAEDRTKRGERGTGEAPSTRDERMVSGVVELLGNGSAFLRVHPPESSEEDVYISAAQVRRCELVSGDQVTGPRRTPRRSERYPSLVRVETINGAPAGEVAEGARYEDRPVAYPSDLLALTSEEITGAADPALQAIARLAPFGRGSRVVIAGPARSGKTTILRRVLGALAGREHLDIALVLAGVRPEEIAEWGESPDGGVGTVEGEVEIEGEDVGVGVGAGAGVGEVEVEGKGVGAGEGATAPAVALSFAAPADAQDQAVQRAIETAKRTAARGGDALVLIDTLDGLHPHIARKAMAAARNLRDGGSLTIIATASRPLGGETTVIALDPASVAAGGGPSLDPRVSGTVRAELLVGEEGAAAIVHARADALSSAD